MGLLKAVLMVHLSGMILVELMVSSLVENWVAWTVDLSVESKAYLKGKHSAGLLAMHSVD